MLRTKILGLDIYGCKEALDRIDDYVDRELGEEETKKVRQHLRLCHECARKFAFEQHFVDGVRKKIDSAVLPEDLSGLKSRVTSLLQKERQTAANGNGHANGHTNGNGNKRGPQNGVASHGDTEHHAAH